MRAYSLDLRTHPMQARQSGISKAEVAGVFAVSVRTIDHYRKQQAETGALAAKPIPGRPRQIPPEQDVRLDAQLRAHPDTTHRQHRQIWQQTHGVRISLATMSRAIARLGWTWKKSVVATERDEAERAAWRVQITTRDVAHFVFVDESSANITLMPRYARAPHDKRAHGSVPRTYRHNTTLVAALSPTGIQASMALTGHSMATPSPATSSRSSCPASSPATSSSSTT